MLAQNFKTPVDLRISDVQFETLVKLLGMLDREEIPAENLVMDTVWCGTAGCLCGWAQRISGGTAFKVTPDGVQPPRRLDTLFMMNISGDEIRRLHIRPDQAAIALRSFLTTGSPNWGNAISGNERI